MSTSSSATGVRLYKKYTRSASRRGSIFLCWIYERSTSPAFLPLLIDSPFFIHNSVLFKYSGCVSFLNIFLNIRFYTDLGCDLAAPVFAWWRRTQDQRLFGFSAFQGQIQDPSDRVIHITVRLYEVLSTPLIWICYSASPLIPTMKLGRS